MTETLVLLPFFLFVVFVLLQIGLLSLGFVIANYGASSAARRAVRADATGGALPPNIQQAFNRLMVAGLQPEGTLQAWREDLSAGAITNNLNVSACVRVDALPFVAQIVSRAHLSPATANQCPGRDGETLYWKSTPPAFVVRGTAKARMNYQ